MSSLEMHTALCVVPWSEDRLIPGHGSQGLTYDTFRDHSSRPSSQSFDMTRSARMPSFVGEVIFSHTISPFSVERSWLEMKGKLNCPVR